MASKLKFSEQLRRAIKRSGVSRYRIAQDTGLHESALCNFMAGRRSMSLRSIDVLWAYLGLKMDQPGARKQKGR